MERNEEKLFNDWCATGTMLLVGCSLSDFGLGNGASDDKTNHHKRINRIKIVIRNLIIVLIIRKIMMRIQKTVLKT